MSISTNEKSYLLEKIKKHMPEFYYEFHTSFEDGRLWLALGGMTMPQYIRLKRLFDDHNYDQIERELLIRLKLNNNS